MSSREIAELTGKAHLNVLRDIRNMLDELEIDQLKFESMSPDGYGRPQPVFNLPKDLTITLISGYNVTMRHRIVTRWQELEAAPQAVALPQNFGEALRVAAENWERAQVAEQALALAAPKAATL